MPVNLAGSDKIESGWPSYSSSQIALPNKVIKERKVEIYNFLGISDRHALGVHIEGAQAPRWQSRPMEKLLIDGVIRTQG